MLFTTLPLKCILKHFFPPKENKCFTHWNTINGFRAILRQLCIFKRALVVKKINRKKYPKAQWFGESFKWHRQGQSQDKRAANNSLDNEHSPGTQHEAPGFSGSSMGKESAWNAGDPSSIPGSGRSPGEGIGYPIQYSGLENSLDCIVQGVTKSQTQLSDFHFHWSALYVFSHSLFPTAFETMSVIPTLQMRKPKLSWVEPLPTKWQKWDLYLSLAWTSKNKMSLFYCNSTLFSCVLPCPGVPE